MEHTLQPVVVNVNSRRLFDSTAKGCDNLKMSKDTIRDPQEKALMTEIGERLRIARERAELTQAQLGIRVGVAQQTIFSIEKADKRTNYYNLVKIERGLGLSPGYLLHGKTPSLLEIEQPLIANCPILTWENAFNWPGDKQNIIENKLFDRIDKKLILNCDSYILQIPDSQYENSDSSDAPFFRKGSYIVVDPWKSYKNGDFVIAKIKNNKRIIFRKYVEYDDGKIFLEVIKEIHKDPYIEITPNIEIIGVMVAHFDLI